MSDMPHVYDLSFVSPEPGKWTYPQIVFTINTNDLELITNRLRIIIDRYGDYAKKYFGKKVEFVFPTANLFEVEFGYRACGILVQSELETKLRINLAQGGSAYAALTIHWLLSAMFKEPLKEGQSSNRHQEIALRTACDHEIAWPHMMSGHLSEPITSWLMERGAANLGLPEEVVTSMKEAFRVMAPREIKKYASECRGDLYDDGRFVLSCFGNACDIAIYPDQLFGKKLMPDTMFGCHNLDSSIQQMTLLSGLARMCELARKSEPK